MASSASSTPAAATSSVLAEIKKGLEALQSGNPRAALAAASAIATPLVKSGTTPEIRELAQNISTTAEAQQKVIGASDADVLRSVTLTLPEPSRTLSSTQHTAWGELNTQQNAINAEIARISAKTDKTMTSVEKAALINLRKAYDVALQAYKSKYISMFGTNAGVKAKGDLAARVNKAFAVWNQQFQKPYDDVYAKSELLDANLQQSWTAFNNKKDAAITAALVVKPQNVTADRDPIKDAAFADAIEAYKLAYDTYKVAAAKAAEAYVKELENEASDNKTLYLTTVLKGNRAALVDAIAKGSLGTIDIVKDSEYYKNALAGDKIKSLTYASALNAVRGTTIANKEEAQIISADRKQQANLIAEREESAKQAMAGLEVVPAPWMPKSKAAYVDVKNARVTVIVQYELAGKNKENDAYKAAVAAYKEAVLTYKNRTEINANEKAQEAEAVKGLEVIWPPVLNKTAIEAYKAVQSAYELVGAKYKAALTEGKVPANDGEYNTAKQLYSEALKAYKEEFARSGFIHSSKSDAAAAALAKTIQAIADKEAKRLEAARTARSIGSIPLPPKEGLNPTLKDQYTYLTSKHTELRAELAQAKAKPENATNIGFKANLDAYTKMVAAYTQAAARKGELYNVLTALSTAKLDDFDAIKTRAELNNVNPTYIITKAQEIAFTKLQSTFSGNVGRNKYLTQTLKTYNLEQLVSLLAKLNAGGGNVQAVLTEQADVKPKLNALMMTGGARRTHKRRLPLKRTTRNKSSV